jgi:hypothetical protein
MPKRVPKIGKSPEQAKHPKQAEVADWNFSELLNTDIKDLEIGASLKRLGEIQVMDWDLRTIVPAIKKIAAIEINLNGGVRKKVMEQDFRRAHHSTGPDAPKSSVKRSKKRVDAQEIQALTARLKNFLEYVAVNLIDEPSQAQIKVSEISQRVLRLKLVLVKRDAAMLIGREGHTAAAIRSVIKAMGRKSGVDVLLQILSHEEEILLAKSDMEK